jgi:septation ring formation regulator
MIEVINMMNNITLELVTYFIIAVILITIILNIIQVVRNNKYKKEINELEREKNKVISAPIMSELSKVEALVKNEKIEERFKNWQKRFNNIKGISIPAINDMLLEADFLLEQKNYKVTLIKIANIEMELYHARKKTDNLLSEIQEITLSEEKNRNIITNLKSVYRELLQTFENTKEDYGEISTSIELQFENIEKRFQEFEDAMDNNDYDEVSHIVKAIDEMIKHMQIVIEEVPSIVLTTSNIIPKRIDEALLLHMNMHKEGYQLDYLNVEYNIDEIKKKVSDIIDRVRVLNLEDVPFELKTFLEYFDNLFNDFEREKLTKKVFEEGLDTFRNKITRLNSLMADGYKQISELKSNYDLSEQELKTLDDLSDELKTLNKDFKSLNETIKTRSFPYSKLNKELEILVLRLSKLEEKLDNIMQSVGSMKDDEERAREQLDNIRDLLRQSKHKIREYKLPIVPDDYFTELKEAQAGIKEIIKELDRKPINIETLNIRVDTARDLVFKLYNTTNEIIKTAILAEMAIVYGNRYRSTKHQLEDGLNKAEVLYIKGEYKKSLELTINTIDIVEPGIYRRLLNLYDNK